MSMTTNGIAYMKARIDEAHYTRSDAENARHNFAVEQLQQEQNEETKRANLARETELHRANVASETNYYLNLQENARHNRVTEEFAGQQLAIQSERAQYQNLLDTANTNLANKRSDFTSAEIIGKQIQNAKDTLAYNLESTYGQVDRVTSGLNGVSFFGIPVGSILTTGAKIAETAHKGNKNGWSMTTPINQSVYHLPYSSGGGSHRSGVR